MSAYGNHNLAFVTGSQYIDYSSTSEQSAALASDTKVVTLIASTRCWIAIGTNPTAAAPSAEKVKVTAFPLSPDMYVDFPIPQGTDAAPIKIAVIRDANDGKLDIIERGI